MEYHKKFMPLIIVAVLVVVGAYFIGKSNRESQKASVLSGIGTVGSVLPSNGWTCIVIYIDSFDGTLDIDTRYSPTDISGTSEGEGYFWEVYKDCIPTAIKARSTTTTPVSQKPAPINRFQQTNTLQLIR